jgi:hypothetical protein
MPKNDAPKGEPTRKYAAASSATSHAISTARSMPQQQQHKRLDRHRRVYFTVWMIAPARELAGSRPVDHLKTDPAPLLFALESFRWR